MRTALIALFLFSATCLGQPAYPPLGAVTGPYPAGKRLLDSRQWSKALEKFNQVISRQDPKADAALYWKAYALNKLAQRDEALAALQTLRASYPASTWLQDAAALEMQIKQGSGQNPTAESQSDDELKLLALNGLARTDPEHAIPAVESLLREAQSPALKREALFVVAQSGSPDAQQLLEKVARGAIDPELQALAVQYLADRQSYQGDLGQLLVDIFHSTSDQDVQWAAVRGLSQIGDKARLARVIAEVPPGGPNEQYRQFLMLSARMGQLQGSARAAQQKLADRAVIDYKTVSDRTTKEGIIEAHAKEALVLLALARIENDSLLRRRIVGHLIELNTPEAREYLLDLLK